MKFRNDLTCDYIREILEYNPSTGEFTWKIRPCKNISIGSKARPV